MLNTHIHKDIAIDNKLKKKKIKYMTAGTNNNPRKFMHIATKMVIMKIEMGVNRNVVCSLYDRLIRKAKRILYFIQRVKKDTNFFEEKQSKYFELRKNYTK